MENASVPLASFTPFTPSTSDISEENGHDP